MLDLARSTGPVAALAFVLADRARCLGVCSQRSGTAGWRHRAKLASRCYLGLEAPNLSCDVCEVRFRVVELFVERIRLQADVEL